MKELQKNVVITGATGGIGFYSALGIAATGAKVIIVGRNAERAEIAKDRIITETQNSSVECVVGDVSSIEKINRLTAAILEKIDKIDVLINNAGYLGSEFSQNEDGVELHFAVNVLAPYLFTQSLLSALKNGDNPRVLNVTGGDKPARIDSDNLQCEKGFKGLMTYTHSKSIMEAMSIALSRELQKEEITVNIVFPGRASTEMTRSLTSRTLPGLMKIMLPFFKWYFAEDGGKSAQHAAQSTIWAATTPELQDVTGRYFDTNMKEQPLHSTAYDLDIQSRILSLIADIRTASST